jgi:uncharacterized protein (TIGR02646 family)
MRQLNRLRTTISSLRIAANNHITRWKATDENEKKRFDSRPWKTPEVLGTLLAIHGRACAYCQGMLSYTRIGTVEHFRPKSIYWWLAYDISNYLLSCSRCNSSIKGGQFPLKENSPQIKYDHKDEITDDLRLLLDPYIDPVEKWTDIEIEDTICYVKNNLDKNINADAYEQVDTTFKQFRINTDPRLLRKRSETIAEALQHALRAIKNDADAYLDLLSMANKYSPFGVYIKHYLRGNYPDLFPSNIDELECIISDLLVDLKMMESIKRKYSLDQKNLDLQKIIYWALASFLVNQNDNDQKRLKRIYEQHGLNQIIEDIYIKILSEP